MSESMMENSPKSEPINQLQCSESPRNNVTEELKNTPQTDKDSLDSVNNSGNKPKWKRRIIHDSDSEEETNHVVTNESNENSTDIFETHKETNHKKLVIDSDSEPELEVTVHNKSFSDDNVLNIEEQPVFTFNSKGELVPENANKNHTNQATILSSLCDPESSDEEIIASTNDEDNQDNREEIVPIKYRRKSKPKSDEIKEPKKMTGKQAAELRKEIISENQRMLREKNVSLPYHKPKSFTLKEFLSRRPKFSSTVPTSLKAPPSVAMKMSTEQLVLISETLKKREEEVKLFYKSESESEGDSDDKDYAPPLETDEKIHENTEKNDGVPEGVSAVNSDENKVEISSELTRLEETPNIPQQVTEKSVLGKEETSLLQSEPNEVSLSESGGNKIVIIGNEVIRGADTNQQTSNEVTKEHDNVASDVAVPSNSESDEVCDKNVKESVITDEISERDDGKERNSMEYEFNLDGLEENSEALVKEHDTKPKSKYEYTDLDKEIENFSEGNPEKFEINEIVDKVSPPPQPKTLSKLELIKERLANVKPKLSGGPDDVIDLETGVAKPNEVVKLMERFAVHNYKKPTHKNKVQLSIVSVESGEIHKETVAMTLDDEDEAVIEEKPGAKLQKLRDELQTQMAQRRSELWQKKATKEPTSEENDTYHGEKEDCGMDDDILDDEEELEISESSEEEPEEIEDDMNEKEDVKKKSAFIDEEAEESDEEGVKFTDEDENADEADAEDEIDDEEADDEENKEMVDDVEESEHQPTKKKFKKILKGFTEDSDDEEGSREPQNVQSHKKLADTNVTVSQEDDDILPPHQPPRSQTPIRPPTEHKSTFEFLTPVSYITGLQNLNNSASKNLKESPVPSIRIINEPSPLKENNWQSSLQKKLFMDMEITDSQVDAICSGKFPDTQAVKTLELADKLQSVDPPISQIPCTSASENERRLVDMCSGEFPSTAEVAERRFSDQMPTSQDLLDICSGKFTGITQCESSEKPEETNTDTYQFNSGNSEIKSLDEDQDLIISQLMDEEEMENFKKRFEAPQMSNTQRRIVEEFEESLAAGGVIDSDDETDTVEVKRKNKKKLVFSDDDDSDNDTNNKEEVIDLHDNVEDEDSEVEMDNVAYDSEENEIELVEDVAVPNLKPSDFFENEAELSESEWGSADEDEKDLDDLEFEQGDAEKFDETKLKTDLEKIHMRRLLDDDTREVKLLQEMLLEDGELHGTGRERQFRWKNVDSTFGADDERKEEDSVMFDEEESEEQWRKKRHEREMFLQEKLSKSQGLEDDALLSDSQLLKIGHKVLQRSQSNSQSGTPAEKADQSESPMLMRSFSLMNQRGSFLSRGDQVLQRLAEYNKVTASLTVGTATAKNSRNFLFQTVSVETSSSLEKKDKKRKASDGTPNAIKRLRLSDNMSPAVKKKPKAKTSLFGTNNW